jgi:hypothetical protein
MNDKSHKTDNDSEYILWRNRRNIWVSPYKAFASGAQITGNEYASYAAAASFLGTLVLACAVIRFIFAFILPIILDKLLSDFGYDVYNIVYYGDPSILFALRVIQNAAAFSVIIILGLWGGRLPRQVLFNKKTRSIAVCVAAVPAAFSLGAIYIVIARLFGGEIRPEAIGIPLTVQLIFGFVFLPVLCELAFRGTLLFIFRQYGDLAAIITVSVAAALLQFEPQLIPAAVITSVILCYFALAAENVIVPIYMHIIMNIVIALYRIIAVPGGGSIAMYLFFGVCFICGIGAAIFIFLKHPEVIETETAKDPLKSSEKLFCMVTSVPVITAITAIALFSLFLLEGKV